jgi:hypothetical protein
MLVQVRGASLDETRKRGPPGIAVLVDLCWGKRIDAKLGVVHRFSGGIGAGMWHPF